MSITEVITQTPTIAPPGRRHEVQHGVFHETNRQATGTIGDEENGLD
jgi:hypothetical protein